MDDEKKVNTTEVNAEEKVQAENTQQKPEQAPRNPDDIELTPEEIKKNLKKRLVSSSILILLLILVSSFFYVHGDTMYFEDTRFLMNTAYTIKTYGIKGFLGMQAAFKKIHQVENLTSFYQQGSGLSSLNKTGSYVYDFNNKQKRDLLREIAMGAKFMYENTDGYFDPSFAALHEIYGFHTPDKIGRLPDDTELANTMLKCGYNHVLHIEGDKLTLNSGSMIDFGGIVGGYSIMCARAILQASGCKAFLIDDAGDIWFEGEKPDKSPWKIAVKDPRGGSSLAMIVSKTPLAISTSGSYERYVTVNGKKYGHIMDPKTGKPADYYDSVTVVSLDPIQSDVLSTALFAMPPEKAYKYAEDKNIAALFLDTKGEITVSTKGKLYFSDIKVK